eukprot:gnl/MRDRNA2_/MRDRNA2_83231_c0_seq5.p1 gnl/MRDRNA2_/MRDRNA2_83231_c0~~gnl/MRDRNA2_/MRDRNA2_83231_c0_seq5.p1  ORF type:complete len:304 (-),score=71.72 gnl/MRDRNA2_/MRDRNA2_83231_c0_seq5:46-957(-)
MQQLQYWQAKADSEEQEKKEKYAQYIVPEGTIHPEIQAICTRYDVDERLARGLNDAMKHRYPTWRSDMDQVDFDMKFAKGNRGGMMQQVINRMRDGTYIGKMPPHPKLARVIEEYGLIGDAQERLTDFLQKRERAGIDWEQDLEDTEARLKGHRNPNMMALKMMVCIQQGKEYPPIGGDPVKKHDEKHGKQHDEKLGRGDQKAPEKPKKKWFEESDEEEKKNEGSRNERRSRSRSRDRGRGASRGARQGDHRDRRDDQVVGAHRDRGNQDHRRREEGRDNDRSRGSKSGSHGGGDRRGLWLRR